MSSFQMKIVGDFCNMRCGYCRNRDYDQKTKTIMTSSILEKAFMFLNGIPQPIVRTNWLGGEPLLAGLDFFKKIIVHEKQYPGKNWSNAVQTNATLVNYEWAEFFKSNNFRIGVSVDGSERTHNIDRINILEKGTYKEVMRGVENLRISNIFPGVICTVTKKTAPFAKEMLVSLIQSGFKGIAFNTFYNIASNPDADIYALTDKMWLQFLVDIFETWLEFDDPSVHIREIDGILAWFKSRSPNSCVFKGNCHQWLVIDYDGNIYPCERLGKSTFLGNVKTLSSYNSLVASKSFLEWKNRIFFTPEKCQSCKLFPLCHNGCVAHRNSRTDLEDVQLYEYCESRIGFYEYLKNRMTTS